MISQILTKIITTDFAVYTQFCTKLRRLFYFVWSSPYCYNEFNESNVL